MIVVMGRGRVGTGLTQMIGDSGLDVLLMAGKAPAPDAELIVLAVPDDAIESVAQRLLDEHNKTPIFLHCAGRLGMSAFGSVLARPQRRVSLGAMHPLISFAAPGERPEGEGYTFAVSGEAPAVQAASKLVGQLGGKSLGPVHGPAYHAAAALIANGASALAHLGAGIFRSLGVEPLLAGQAAGSLLRSVAHNLERHGTLRALTGPVVRGDRAAVAGHREALRADSRAAYDAVSSLIVDVAERAGLAAETAASLRAELEREI